MPRMWWTCTGDPAAVVKQHPNSSLVLGARMLAQGGGDAFISAGNTGALLTAATLLVKRIRGHPPRGVLGRSFRRRTATPFSSMRARMPSARRNSCCSSAAWARSTRRRRSHRVAARGPSEQRRGRYEGRPAPPRGPSASEARRGAGDHPLRRQCRGARGAVRRGGCYRGGRASPATSCSRPWRARPCSCPT